jgi:hypothetical protein
MMGYTNVWLRGNDGGNPRWRHRALVGGFLFVNGGKARAKYSTQYQLLYELYQCANFIELLVNATARPFRYFDALLAETEPANEDGDGHHRCRNTVGSTPIEPS